MLELLLLVEHVGVRLIWDGWFLLVRILDMYLVLILGVFWLCE